MCSIVFLFLEANKCDYIQDSNLLHNLILKLQHKQNCQKLQGFGRREADLSIRREKHNNFSYVTLLPVNS